MPPLPQILLIGTVLSLFLYLVLHVLRRMRGSSDESAFFGDNPAKRAFYESAEEEAKAAPEEASASTSTSPAASPTTRPPPGPEERRKGLLFAWALQTIDRTLKLSEEKPSLLSLNQSGMLHEGMLKTFLKAEKETNQEIFDIQYEAELLREGWSKSIMGEAMAFYRQHGPHAVQMVSAAANGQPVPPPPSGTQARTGPSGPAVPPGARAVRRPVAATASPSKSK